MSDQVPPDLRYTKEHEWVRENGGELQVGITAFAVEQLGDVTLVNLDVKVGDEVGAGKPFGTIESVKTLSDLYAPVAGKVVHINDELDPEAGARERGLLRQGVDDRDRPARRQGAPRAPRRDRVRGARAHVGALAPRIGTTRPDLAWGPGSAKASGRRSRPEHFRNTFVDEPAAADHVRGERERIASGRGPSRRGLRREGRPRPDPASARRRRGRRLRHLGSAASSRARRRRWSR